MSLVTVEKAMTRSEFSGLSSTRVQELLDAATILVERHCRRTFAASAYVELYDGASTPHLVLRQYPLNETAPSAVENGVSEVRVFSYWGSEDLILDLDTVSIDKSRGIVTLRPDAEIQRFPYGRGNVQVSYQAGYEVIPADLQEAVLMTAYKLKTLGFSSSEVKMERLGDYAVQYRDEANKPVTLAARDILRGYRKINVYGGTGASP